MTSSVPARSRTHAQRHVQAEPLPSPCLSPIELQARAGEAATLLKALANPDRLALLCQLVGGERSVGELGLAAGIEQPSLSQQLAVLRSERLVATRREGKQVIYCIDSPAAQTLLEVLYRLFCASTVAPSAPQADSAPSPSPERARRRPFKTAA